MANWAKVDNENTIKEIVVFDEITTPAINLPEGWSWVQITNQSGIPAIDGKYIDGAFVSPNLNIGDTPNIPYPNDGKNYNWKDGAWVEKTPQREVPPKPNDTAKFNFDTWEWEV